MLNASQNSGNDNGPFHCPLSVINDSQFRRNSMPGAENHNYDRIFEGSWCQVKRRLMLGGDIEFFITT